MAQFAAPLLGAPLSSVPAGPMCPTLDLDGEKFRVMTGFINTRRCPPSSQRLMSRGRSLDYSLESRCGPIVIALMNPTPKRRLPACAIGGTKGYGSPGRQTIAGAGPTAASESAARSRALPILQNLCQKSCGSCGYRPPPASADQDSWSPRRGQPRSFSAPRDMTRRSEGNVLPVQAAFQPNPPPCCRVVARSQHEFPCRRTSRWSSVGQVRTPSTRGRVFRPMRSPL